MKYIAYGSNMNIEQMMYRCPNSKIAAATYVEDYTLEFCTVATIVPKEGSKVPVVIWDITPEDEISLDVYEGYPNLYRKENISVDIEGKQVNAMAYIMNPHQLGMPTTGYYNGIKAGYKSAGFDPNILKKFLEETKSLIQNTRYYLAYGKDILKNELHNICKSARFIKKNFVQGIEMCFKGEKNRAIADIEKSKYGKTPVALYSINVKEEALLDKHKKAQYEKKHEMTITIDGILTETYLYHGSKGDYNLPSDEYYESIEKGYRQVGHNNKLLIDTLDRTSEMMEQKPSIQEMN